MAEKVAEKEQASSAPAVHHVRWLVRAGLTRGDGAYLCQTHEDGARTWSPDRFDARRYVTRRYAAIAVGEAAKNGSDARIVTYHVYVTQRGARHAAE